MSIVRSLLDHVLTFVSDLSPKKKKIILANQEAIKKMEELNRDALSKRIVELEKEIAQLSKDIISLIDTQKTNQEFLLYLCTTNEELLNTISEGEVVIAGPQENEIEEEDFIGAQWSTKKNNVLN